MAILFALHVSVNVRFQEHRDPSGIGVPSGVPLALPDIALYPMRADERVLAEDLLRALEQEQHSSVDVVHGWGEGSLGEKEKDPWIVLVRYHYIRMELVTEDKLQVIVRVPEGSIKVRGNSHGNVEAGH